MAGLANVIPGRLKGGAIRPSCHLWPNGEYTMGYAPGAGFEEEKSWQQWLNAVGGPIDLAMHANSHRDLEEVCVKRGQKGMTSQGSRMVRNCADALEKFYGKERISFATVTLPRLEYEEFWHVSSNWAEIVRRFYQKIVRALAKRGGSRSYVGVTELQPRRTNRDGIPALHLHFIFVGRKTKSGNWLVHYSEIRQWWKEVLEWCVGRELQCDHVENVQEVRESAGGYLSKYMSKGSDLVEPIRQSEVGWNLPTAWYNISLKLKRWVVDHTMSNPEMSELMESAWRSGALREGSEYFYEGTIEECSGPGPHFCLGRLMPSDYDDMVAIYRAQQVAPMYEVC
jgi:hypothetical protein